MKKKYILSIYFVVLWLISLVYSTGALDNKLLMIVLLPGALVVFLGFIYIVYTKRYKLLDKKEYVLIGLLLLFYMISSLITMGFSFRELYFIYVVIIGVMIIGSILIDNCEFDSSKLFFEMIIYISFIAGVFGLVCYYNQISIFLGTARFGFTDDFINAKGILSIMTNTNSYALICVISLMLSIIVISMRKNGKYKIYFLIINIVLQGYCLMLTASRTAIMIFLAFIGFYFILFFKHKYKKKLIFMISVIFGIILLLTVLGVIPDDIAIINKFTSGDISSGRSVLWKAGLDGFFENPIFGVGIRNSLSTITHYLGVENNTLGVHNGYIAVLLANGIVVFGTIITAIVSYLWDGIKNNNKISKNIYVELMICFILAMLVGNITESILFGDFNFSILIIWTMLMLQRKLSKISSFE